MSDEVREIAGLVAAHVRLWRDLGVLGVRGVRARVPTADAAASTTAPQADLNAPASEGTAPSEARRDPPREVRVAGAVGTAAALGLAPLRGGVRPPERAGAESSTAAERGPPTRNASVRPERAGAPISVAVGTSSSAGTEVSPPPLESLEALRAWVGDCQRCPLCAGRTHLVFGSGNPAARLVFVGEGPGQDEDLEGEPFVGAAGRLLTDIIEKGMKLPRSEVYICNVVKCRPLRNRNPEPDEIAACSPILRSQLRLVGPEIIIALGKFAAQTLLASDTPITRLRGQWHEWEGIPVMPTFHPAYLLRNPAFKREVWADIRMVLARLGAAR